MTKKPLSPVAMRHRDYAGLANVPTEAVPTWQEAGWIILDKKDEVE